MGFRAMYFILILFRSLVKVSQYYHTKTERLEKRCPVALISGKFRAWQKQANGPKGRGNPLHLPYETVGARSLGWVQMIFLPPRSRFGTLDRGKIFFSRRKKIRINVYRRVSPNRGEFSGQKNKHSFPRMRPTPTPLVFWFHFHVHGTQAGTQATSTTWFFRPME